MTKLPRAFACRWIPSRGTRRARIARIVQLKIEQEALKKVNRPRFTRTDSASSKASSPIWRRRRPPSRPGEGREGKLGAAQKLKEEIEKARNDLAIASATATTRKPAAWRTASSAARKAACDAESREGAAGLVDEVVSPDHVAQVVSRWTGVPVDKMLEGEKRETPQDGGGACAPRGRGRMEAVRAGRRQCAALALVFRIQPSHRVVHVPRAHRVGKTE